MVLQFELIFHNLKPSAINYLIIFCSFYDLKVSNLAEQVHCWLVALTYCLILKILHCYACMLSKTIYSDALRINTSVSYFLTR